MISPGWMNSLELSINLSKRNRLLSQPPSQYDLGVFYFPKSEQYKPGDHPLQRKRQLTIPSDSKLSIEVHFMRLHFSVLWARNRHVFRLFLRNVCAQEGLHYLAWFIHLALFPACPTPSLFPHNGKFDPAQVTHLGGLAKWTMDTQTEQTCKTC
jgi:hypothetical protein